MTSPSADAAAAGAAGVGELSPGSDQGSGGGGNAPVRQMLLNSLVMALGITIGKIIDLAAVGLAIVYFRFRFRMLFFWLIFLTLMLPVEVRIVPTYEVVAVLACSTAIPA
jgi:ABC-type glycerol-3-phosphate transport system permease component